MKGIQTHQPLFHDPTPHTHHPHPPPSLHQLQGQLKQQAAASKLSSVEGAVLSLSQRLEAALCHSSMLACVKSCVTLPCLAFSLSHTPTHPRLHKVDHHQSDQNDTATHTNTHKCPRARERSEWGARTVARGSALAALRIARAILGPQELWQARIGRKS